MNYNGEHMPPSDPHVTSVPTPAAPAPAPIDAPKSRTGIGIGIGLGIAALLLAAGGYYWWSGSQGEAALRTTPVRIGIIQLPQVKEADEGFMRKIRELGYADAEFDLRVVPIGPNYESEVRKVVEDFLLADVDLIFADFESQAKIAQTVTAEKGRTDMPIVFISRLHDPVTMGLVDSYRSSGNNLTGVATNLSSLIQRHMQFIKDISPTATKLGVFGKGFQVPAVAGEYYDVVKREAPRFGLEIVEYTTDLPPPQAKQAFDTVAATIRPGDIDALMHIGGHYYATQEAGEGRLAIRLGIPMATNYEDFPRGGHFTLSNGTFESGEQAAIMADKIIRGAAPTDIPIEYQQREILSLHLGRAAEAGFAFPESMISIATHIYEDDSQFPEFEDH